MVAAKIKAKLGAAGRSAAAAALGVVLLAGMVRAQCAGDCDVDGEVTVDELVTMINIGLGSIGVAACAAGESDLDGEISIDEIIRGVDDALGDCNLPQVRRSFDFRSGRQGWVAGFSDYSPGMADILELDAGVRSLPPELQLSGSGFLLSGANRSDDLFMFLKRQLLGIQPGRDYSVDYTIVFASAAPSGCAGIGGAPGESVYLKAGAAALEPQAVLDETEDRVRMNVDKGDQATGGVAASVVGNVANGLPCDSTEPPPPFVALRRHHRHVPAVTASPVGELWLLLGTDSGFEGTTTLYYQRIEVSVTPVD